ncbi:MAG: S41 family peptidase [Candidatus Nealsonbacteria bacterium]|nr:MAG: S41 family peptidase [Candidatus Nealsonbacteria bacterium]
MIRLNKRKLNLFFLVIVIFAVFGLGFWTGENQVVCDVCPPEDINFSLFWEAYHKLQEKFVDKEKIDIQKIIYGAISGMVKSLEDPYTVFLPPEDTKKFKEDVEGVFEGVGMEIGIRKGQVQVIAPLEGTPAQKAGLRAGDKIIKVNDILTMDLTIDEVVSLIRGPRGTEVLLTIYREDWGETQEVGIVRGVIEVPSLKWELLTSQGEAGGKDVDIAYIKLYQFSRKAALDFRKASFEILDSPAKKIILDLRNNPGGLLVIAQDIAGWFLESGELVVIEDFRNGNRIEYKSYGNGTFLDYKIVILINEGSASGSEILAGALRDNRDILLIGKKSFGKGSVQELEDLRGGSSLKITIAKWLTPKGQLITGSGLEPDIRVEMSSEDYDEGRDPQLDKAVEVIKNL